MRLTSVHKKTAISGRWMRGSACRRPLHNDHRNHPSGSSAPMPLVNTADRGTQYVRHGPTGLTNVTYRHPANKFVLYFCESWCPFPIGRVAQQTSEAEFHSTHSQGEQKQNRGSGAACNDSCIKRISKLTQLATLPRKTEKLNIYSQHTKPLTTLPSVPTRHALIFFTDGVHLHTKTNTGKQEKHLSCPVKLTKKFCRCDTPY